MGIKKDEKVQEHLEQFFLNALFKFLFGESFNNKIISYTSSSLNNSSVSCFAFR